MTFGDQNQRMGKKQDSFVRFLNQTAATLSIGIFTEIAGNSFQLISGGTQRRQNQGLINKGPVWISRSMGCVPSLGKPLQRGTQDQKACLASLSSDYTSCRQLGCIKLCICVTLEANWYATPRRLS